MPVAFYIGSRNNAAPARFGRIHVEHIRPKANESEIQFSRRAGDIIAASEPPAFVVVSPEAPFLPVLLKRIFPWTSIIGDVSKNYRFRSFEMGPALKELGLPASFSAAFSPVEYFGAASSAKAFLSCSDYLDVNESIIDIFEITDQLKTLYPHLAQFILKLYQTTHLLLADREHKTLFELLTDESLAIMPGTLAHYRVREKDFFEKPAAKEARVVIPANCLEIYEGAAIGPANSIFFMPNANSWHSRLIWRGTDHSGNVLGGMILVRGHNFAAETDFGKFIECLRWLKFQAETRGFSMEEFKIWRPLYSNGRPLDYREVKERVLSFFPGAHSDNSLGDYSNGALCAIDFWDFQYQVPTITHGTNGVVNFRAMELF